MVSLAILSSCVRLYGSIPQPTTHLVRLLQLRELLAVLLQLGLHGRFLAQIALHFLLVRLQTLLRERHAALDLQFLLVEARFALLKLRMQRLQLFLLRPHHFARSDRLGLLSSQTTRFIPRQRQRFFVFSQFPLQPTHFRGQPIDFAALRLHLCAQLLLLFFFFLLSFLARFSLLRFRLRLRFPLRFPLQNRDELLRRRLRRLQSLLLDGCDLGLLLQRVAARLEASLPLLRVVELLPQRGGLLLHRLDVLQEVLAVRLLRRQLRRAAR